MKVAIVERKLFGGTCINTGCTPTKTMIASAYAVHMVRRAADFGVVSNGSARVDMKRVKARKDAVSGESRTGVESWLRGMTNCTVYRGHARFESPTEVSVGSDRLAADRIFINVGCRAVVPQMPGIEGVPYFTNRSIMAVGVGAGVLLRALEPLQGIDWMQRVRGRAGLLDLAPGARPADPAMQIDLQLGLTRNADRKLRFYERGNPYVSGPKRLRE